MYKFKINCMANSMKHLVKRIATFLIGYALKIKRISAFSNSVHVLKQADGKFSDCAHSKNKS